MTSLLEDNFPCLPRRECERVKVAQKCSQVLGAFPERNFKAETHMSLSRDSTAIIDDVTLAKKTFGLDIDRLKVKTS